MEQKHISPWPAVVGCLILQLCVGILYTWSVFRDSVQAAFGGWAGVSMVSSYMLMAFVVGNLVGGVLNDKRGPKFTCYVGIILFAAGIFCTGLLTTSTISLIYLTYCVMGGLGSGIVYGACISCIQKWLPHRRGFASGLAISAFGLSSVVFTPVARSLMGVFTGSDGIVSFRPVFCILGGAFLLIGILACLLVRLPNQAYLDTLPVAVAGNSAAVAAPRDYSLGQACRTLPFWLIFLNIFFINGTWNLATPIIATLGIERGLTPALAAACVALAGIPNAAGRLVMATLSDKIGRVATMIILCVMTFIGAVALTFITGIPYMIAIFLIAFAYGGPSALNAAMSTDFFGPKNSGTNYGIIMMALGLSSIFFNWVSNSILNQDPTATFVMGAITAIIPIFLMLGLNKLQKNWGKD